MLSTVENGSVTFVVPGEFIITLSLPGSEFTHPWRILDLIILVKSAGDGYDNAITEVQDHQTAAVRIVAQKILNQGAQTSSMKWRLVALYDYLRKKMPDFHTIIFIFFAQGYGYN